MRSVDILRAIGDIDDKYIEEAMPFVYKKKKEFNVFKYMPAFFGLFLVVFIGTKLVNQEETMIVNPIVTYQTLKEAEDSVGFDFNVDLSDFDNLTYSTINNEILEISYSDGDNYLICRKSKGSEDNSGDYNKYDVLFDKVIDDVDIVVKQENNKILLTFEDDGYFYSFSSDLLSEEELFEIVGKMLK